MIHLALLIISFGICAWAAMFVIWIIGIILTSRIFWFIVFVAFLIGTISNFISQYPHH